MFCPFMENFNKECNKVLTFRNLSYAMKLCNGDFQRCPIYLKLKLREKTVSKNLVSSVVG